ncbi:MAG: protein kinase [Gemmatimonadales bacterium]
MDLRAQLQDHLGTAFIIDRELGGGGMSRVFLANEVRLSRRVVVKVLNPSLVQGLNAERFEREILLVASLQQANIVPVLAAGEVAGIPYYTMPFVEGESLRTRLTGLGLPIGDVVAILRDVVKALAYAHAHGIVHRDIKPDNVLLSGGTAVVTDFGIAKALAASQTTEHAAAGPGAALTQTGTSIGTPAYMAPEQVAGDPAVDQRVDLYALGCLSFELLTGKTPFGDRTPQRMLAGHLSEVPPAVAGMRFDCPVALSDLVARLLEKDPARRPQTASEVLATLDTVLTSSSPMLAQSPAASLPRALALYVGATVAVAILARAAVLAIGLPEWVFPGAMIVMLLGLPVLLITGYVQRVRRQVLTATPTLTPGGTMRPQLPAGTVATMALKASPHLTFRRAARFGGIAMGIFVLLIVGFMALRAAGIGAAGSLFAAGKLSEDDRIVFADFTTAKEDSALVPILMEAVRAALSQSKSVHLLAPSEIAAALTQMKRDRATPLDLPLAREVATRTGAKAVLGGRLVRIGNGYVVSLELSNPESGTLASYQATADGPSQLLEAVDGVTRKLRGKIGESLKQVQKSIPLQQATTTSLEALRKYSEAVTANDIDRDYARAARAAREAVALDSTFALAWRKLAVAINNGSGSQAARDSALEKAARYADKLPDREKYLAIGAYYNGVRTAADRGKALAAYRAAYEADSNSSVAANALNLIYNDRRQADSATRYARRQLELQPNVARAISYGAALAYLGRYDEAEALVDSVLRATPEAINDPSVQQARRAIFLIHGQRDSAAALLPVLVKSPIIPARIGALSNMIDDALIGGHLNQAQAVDSTRSALLRSLGAEVPSEGLTTAAIDIVWREKSAEGVRMLDALRGSSEWSSADPKDRPYEFLVTLYAWAGEPARAREMYNRYLQENPVAKAPAARAGQSSMQADLALAEGKYDEALRLFRAADVREDGAPGKCEDCTLFNYARTFDQAGQKDSAIAAYERYLGVPSFRRDQDWLSLAQVERRLAELYDERNEPKKAIPHYAAFTELWKDADPVLQPAVAAARKRLGELVAKEGR